MMMLDRQYDARTLDDLVMLIHDARPSHDWQTPGIKAAIVSVSQRPETITLAQLAYAALNAAADPSNRNPASIGFDANWSVTKPKRAEVPDDRRCVTCHQPEHLHGAIAYRDHEFESVADHTRATTPTRTQSKEQA